MIYIQNSMILVVSNQLVDYIVQMRLRGTPDEQIVAGLRQMGWRGEMIKEALKAAQPAQVPPKAPVTSPLPKPSEQMQKTRTSEKNYEKISFIERSKIILFDPRKFFSNMRSSGYGDAINHYLTLGVIAISLSIPVLTIIGVFAGPSGPSTTVIVGSLLGALISVIFSLIYMFVILLSIGLGAVIYSIVFKIAGKRKFIRYI